MSEVLREFLDPEKTIAVVGATNNPEKWGYKLYRFFKGRYREVFPVNPKYEKVLGDKCYPSLKALPKTPDIVDLVVRSDIAVKYVKECIELGIRMIWFQPGSESEEALELCRKHGIIEVHGMCLMEEGKKSATSITPIFSSEEEGREP